MSNRFARLVVATSLVAALGAASIFTQAVSAKSQSVRPQLKVVNKGYLTIGTDATYPPMEFINSSNNKFQGADIDFGKAIAKWLHLRAKFLNIKFESLIPTMLTHHSFDIIMSSMNDTPGRRQEGVAFVHYLKAAEAIVVNTSSSIHANSYNQMCGHSLSVENGTTEQLGIQAANNGTCKSNPIQMQGYDTDTEAFQAFFSGHAESYTTDVPVALQYIAGSKGKYRKAGKTISSGQFYGIGMPKSNTKLYAAVKGAFKGLRSNGAYKRIMKKWGVAGGII